MVVMMMMMMNRGIIVRDQDAMRRKMMQTHKQMHADTHTHTHTLHIYKDNCHESGLHE